MTSETLGTLPFDNDTLTRINIYHPDGNGSWRTEADSGSLSKSDFETLVKHINAGLFDIDSRFYVEDSSAGARVEAHIADRFLWGIEPVTIVCGEEVGPPNFKFQPDTHTIYLDPTGKFHFRGADKVWKEMNPHPDEFDVGLKLTTTATPKTG